MITCQCPSVPSVPSINPIRGEREIEDHVLRSSKEIGGDKGGHGTGGRRLFSFLTRRRARVSSSAIRPLDAPISRTLAELDTQWRVLPCSCSETRGIGNPRVVAQCVN